MSKFLPPTVSRLSLAMADVLTHAPCTPLLSSSSTLFPYIVKLPLSTLPSVSSYTRKSVISVRAEMKGRGPSRERGGRWLSSVTRHIRIYVGYIDPISRNMDQRQLDKLSLILDPDDEFIWPEDKCQKVYDYFTELVDNYAGAPLEEYTLRLIGSDLEHFIRKMLLAGEIKYNLNCRVLNFSMGKPRLNVEEVETA